LLLVHVLVTGGAGFIGSHLVDRLLADGHQVRVLDVLDAQVHDGVPDYLATDAELVIGDVRDHAVVARCLEGVEAVVHLAAVVGVAQSMYEIERYASVNVVGTAVLLEELIPRRDRIGKLVVASSNTIYGEGLYRCPVEQRDVSPPLRPEAQLAERSWETRCPSCGAELQPLPTPESKPLNPTSVYATGKRDQEEMVISFGRAYKLPATALRFFNAYGPRQALSNPYTGVAAIFAARLLNGRAPVIFEEGLQSRDFVHVSDIAAAITATLQPGRADGQVLNIGTGRSVSVAEVASVLARGLGVEIEPELPGDYRTGDIRHCFAATELAVGALGFSAQVGFEAGMAELIEWLAGQTPVDRVEEATAALRARGLAR
jgi:dTDP-L-rhamnose 4-epimerase